MVWRSSNWSADNSHLEPDSISEINMHSEFNLKTEKKVNNQNSQSLWTDGCCYCCSKEVGCSFNFGTGAGLRLMAWRPCNFLIEKMWAAEKQCKKEEPIKNLHPL
jgi:hypothetical protein